MRKKKYLKIRLKGLLQSWCRSSTGSKRRGTENEPTKSGVVGMFSSGLGYKRGDPRIEELFAKVTLFMNPEESDPGTLIEDFQTIQDVYNPVWQNSCQ